VPCSMREVWFAGVRIEHGSSRRWYGFLESKRAKTHMAQVLINTAPCEHARAIGLGEGRGPTRPLGTHHIDGGVWNAWV
jgi:hypothetical protein